MDTTTIFKRSERSSSSITNLRILLHLQHYTFKFSVKSFRLLLFHRSELFYLLFTEQHVMHFYKRSTFYKSYT